MSRALCCALLLLAACPRVPTHAGYAPSDRTPWDRAETVELDEHGAAKIHGEVSYPERQRARWYAVDLVDPSSLSLRLTFDPLAGAEESDLGVEVLDAAYRVLTEADEEEERGEQQKRRELTDLAPGRYLIHVFARGKTDRAEFTVKLRAEPSGVALALLGGLPAVPAADDARRVADKGKGGKDERIEKKDPPPPPRLTGLAARVSEYGTSGGGTRVILNKGSDDGVSVGAAGYLVSAASGRKLSGSDFKVTAVSAGECQATVKLSVDQVKANTKVIIVQ